MKNLNFKAIIKFSLFTFALLTINSACQKDDSGKVTEEKEINTSKEGEIIVGAKIENPYSLKNMQSAYESLTSNLGLKSAEVLEPTHYYVRFLPKDTSEYNALKADTTLTLFCYPLDCELSEGDFYHDKSLPENQITWQYTKVPISYVFGRVHYEILEELYIPVETEVGDLKSGSSLSWYNLLDESMKITGNLDKEITIQNESNDAHLKGLFPSKWNPSATILVWDDVLGKSIPLVGAKVKARHWLHWDTEITNSDGYAKLEKFRYSVNYSIVWERAHWDIRDGWTIQAYYNGPNGKRSHWDLNITSGKSLSYATIHRAAHRYYYGNNLGLRPPLTTLKIAYLDEKGDNINGDYWSWTSVSPTILNTVLPNIRIYGYDSGGKRKTNEIYATASHEMAHAAHCDWMGNVQYWQATKYMRESWAVAVGWSLTTQEYSDLNANFSTSFSSNLNRQMWNANSSSKAYSPLFIDLVDDFNQQVRYGKSYPNDIVTGYTMNSLNKILLKSPKVSSCPQGKR